jgi:hypothetical protein
VPVGEENSNGKRGQLELRLGGRMRTMEFEAGEASEVYRPAEIKFLGAESECASGGR